jgi:hypothetical protein
LIIECECAPSFYKHKFHLLWFLDTCLPHVHFTSIYKERRQLKTFLTQFGPALPSCRTHLLGCMMIKRWNDHKNHNLGNVSAKNIIFFSPRGDVPTLSHTHLLFPFLPAIAHDDVPAALIHAALPAARHCYRVRDRRSPCPRGAECWKYALEPTGFDPLVGSDGFDPLWCKSSNGPQML